MLLLNRSGIRIVVTVIILCVFETIEFLKMIVIELIRIGIVPDLQRIILILFKLRHLLPSVRLLQYQNNNISEGRKQHLLTSVV